MAAQLSLIEAEPRRTLSPADLVRADALAKRLQPEPEPIIILLERGAAIAHYGTGATAANAAAALCRETGLHPNHLTAKPCEGEPVCCGVIPVDPRSKAPLATVFGLTAREMNRALMERGRMA